MIYTVIKLIKTANFEGVLMKNQYGKEYITNGVIKWEAINKRMKQCKIVDSIDKEKLLKRWNKFFTYEKLIF
ncbi:hypothetical protein FDB61_15750 [Clostridium botulinum]|nr:hypothetical protein [Clostridium botulinum]